MKATTSTLLCQHGQKTSRHGAIATHLDALLTDARPRLLRLAGLNGIPIDAAEDVVQETLVEAWEHLGNLREPERFDAWLDGICRNMCRRQVRAQARDTLSNVSTSTSYVHDDDDPADVLADDIPDPGAFDLVEELDRQDLAMLLDRALGHLPSEAREIVEMSYLEEVPQREVALQLGMTIGALEQQLYRARRQLRQLLNGEMRAEAEAFGLLDAEPSMGWRETRLWCWLCGRQRLRGIFERQADGHDHMRLRCPLCSKRYNMDVVNTVGLVSLEGLHSFRPAFKRTIETLPQRYLSSLRQQACLICGTAARVRVMAPEEAVQRFDSILDRYWLVVECPSCGTFGSDTVAVLLYHRAITSFIEQHARFVYEPGKSAQYAGRPAIRACLIDPSSAEQLTIMAHPQTLQILAVFSE